VVKPVLVGAASAANALDLAGAASAANALEFPASPYNPSSQRKLGPILILRTWIKMKMDDQPFGLLNATSSFRWDDVLKLHRYLHDVVSERSTRGQGCSYNSQVKGIRGRGRSHEFRFHEHRFHAGCFDESRSHAAGRIP
jgi:hypothetical protein